MWYRQTIYQTDNLPLNPLFHLSQKKLSTVNIHKYTTKVPQAQDPWAIIRSKLSKPGCPDIVRIQLMHRAIIWCPGFNNFEKVIALRYPWAWGTLACFQIPTRVTMSMFLLELNKTKKFYQWRDRGTS